MPVIHLQRKIKAHADVVWRVISDLSGFADVSPHVSKVEMLGGEKETARRRLHSPNGYSWTEHCVSWDEGKSYAMEVDSSDGVYPFKKMHRRFELEEQPDGVVLRMHYKYRPKYGIFGRIADALFLHRKRRNLYEELLNNWIARIRDLEWAYTVTVATILQSKGHDVVTAREDNSIIDVARTLRRNRIGAVLIRDASGQLVGLASERDITSALGDHGPTALELPIGDVMSRKLVVCEPHHDMGFVMACMTDRRVRHLPVLEDGELVGIISIGDIVKARIYSLESQSETMQEYIAGREWRYHHKLTGVHDVAALRHELGKQ
ncbi:MAG: CBS domain-containing protein [Gammaproteobacteria bacterium]|nr:CBS domain-containing protein [Gammaproteobacteria bacterium]MDH3769037.1 CBS domain-containing protein [Gammaproteobacteria bacterium]